MSWFKKKAIPQPCPHRWIDLIPVPPVAYMRECRDCKIRQGSPVPFEQMKEGKDEPGKSDR